MNARRWVLAGVVGLGLATTILWTQAGTGTPGPLPRDPAGGPPSARPTAAGPRGAAARQALRRTVAEPWCHGAPVGRTIEFAFTLDHRVTVRGELPDQPRSVTTMEASRLTGTAAWTVLDRRGDEILLHVALPNVAVTPAAGGHATPEARLATAAAVQALQAGFAVRAGVDGNTRGYRFAADLDAKSRAVARTLVSAFRFVVPEPTAEAWRTEEADASGAYRGDYAARPADTATTDLRIQRRRDRDAPSADALATPEVTGTATASFARHLGWICGADVHETTRTAIANLPAQIEAELVGALRLRAFRDGDVPSPDWSGPWASVSGADEDREASIQATIDARWRRELAGTDLADLLLAADAATDRLARARTFTRLMHWLRLEPGRATQALAMIRTAGDEAPSTRLLVDALGAAGHGEAQTALAELHTDRRQSLTLRHAATQSLFQIRAPQPALVDAVFATVETPATFADLEARSLLLLGTFSDRSDATTLDRLLEYGRRANEPPAVGVWLEALGNTSDARALAAATPYLEAPAPMLRFAAVTALRQQTSPAARRALHQHARTDADARVRRHAVRTLAALDRLGSIELLGEVLREDAEHSVRRASLVELATVAADSALARKLLADAAQQDPEPTLRQLAADLLGRAG
ncbi:MAG: HEAT repeat domain-containing protein [Planctomycetota bacterium]